MNRAVRIGLLIVGAGMVLAFSATARAVEPDLKGVTDPTKPPSGVLLRMMGDRAGRGLRSTAGETATALSAMPASSGASAAAGSASAATGSEASKPTPLSVSSIRVDLATGEGVAIVGDDLVHVGDTVRGMRVVAITASEVQLKGPEGIRKLQLPDVIEQSGAKAARAAKRGRKEMK